MKIKHDCPRCGGFKQSHYSKCSDCGDKPGWKLDAFILFVMILAGMVIALDVMA